MKILMVYPDYPDTFWSFRHALKFIFKKSSCQPLGLLTVSSLLPEKWEKRLVDMNVGRLKDDDIEWADLVFISAISIQKDSARKVLERCRGLGAVVVTGGPLFTVSHKDFDDLVDHFVLGEAEITIPEFIDDLEKGRPRGVYDTDDWADMGDSPVPDWDLIDMKKYATMNIQYSRGCPFNCEFCDIVTLCGRHQRTKSAEQIIAELDSLYDRGWRRAVFFVDDNFVGNKKKLKREILPVIARWMKEKNHPFGFITQASIELSDDDELIRLMVDAGFDTVFVGIETPNPDSLTECSKFQNRNRDLLESVKHLHNSGLQVQGGFIVGFDSDPVNIFETQISFIQKSGIVTAMVGLLKVLPRTRLYRRLEKEERLLSESSGDNTDFSTNFIPKMDYDELLKGYRKIVNTIYSPRYYYRRVKTFLREYKPLKKQRFRFRLDYVGAFLRSILFLGIMGRERFHYWKLFFWTAFRRPRLLSLSVTLAIYGYHFRKVFNRQS